jgi:hypothetical protein
LWSWSYGSTIFNSLWNQCLSPLTLWVQIPLRGGVLDTTLCDKVCQWLATGQWFSPCTLVSSTTKTDHHNITEILLKAVVLFLNYVKSKMCAKIQIYINMVRVKIQRYNELKYCGKIKFESCTLCDKVCQWLATGQWFSPCTLVSSTTKTDHQDITEILLKVALHAINQTTPSQQICICDLAWKNISYTFILQTRCAQTAAVSPH